MKIQVTQEDINQGVRACTNNCAVALALKRAGFPFVQVHSKSVITKMRDDFTVAESIPLPEEVAFFIDSFDDGDPVGPIEFELSES